jgi:TonB family protein
MSDRTLSSCVLASFLIHAAAIAAASLMLRAMPATSIHVPIELVNVPRVEEVKTPQTLQPPPPAPNPKAAKAAAPKLLLKPEIIETAAPVPGGNTKEEIKQPEKVIEPLPRLASLPAEPGSVKGGWNVDERPGEAEGGAAGAGNLFGKGDVGVVDGSGLSGGGGGKGTAGLGRGEKGDGKGGGGAGTGDAPLGQARPLGGYQVKPRYPESARRAGAQGVTVLKLRILENGRVGEVLVEKSAGHPDLDMEAADAVKKWLFEPARMGKQPVAIWVLLPIKFELN